ncbi:hypothetical protein FRB90_012808 [Tulasnella sp. 427]|nr:hypothetical protein FRB90_012808 [Tulasnella sp. 427]
MDAPAEPLPHVSTKRKRQAPTVGEADEPEAALHEPKRNKICLRAVVDGLTELRIDPSRLTVFDNRIRKDGGSAHVVRCTLLTVERTSPRLSSSMSFRTVAVKKFKLDNNTLSRKAQTAAFANELSLLSEIRHENIVELRGFVEDPEENIAWIVFPWESNGNLREFVQSQNWVIPERLSLLNILVNSASRAIITDFGSARKIDTNLKMKETKSPTSSISSSDPHVRNQNSASPQVQIGECGTFMTLTGPIYTLRWAAPEILQDEGFSLASDIWAFAWICWEIMTGSIPFADLNKHSSIVISVTQGKLPELANNEHTRQIQALCEMMSRCWEMDRANRPIANNCVTTIGRMGRVTPSIEESYKRSDTRYRVERLISLASSNCENGMADEAMRCLQEALEIIRWFNDQPAYPDWVGAIAKALWRLGKVYHTKGEYSRAEDAYIRAEKISEGHDAEGNVADAREDLGDVYRLRGEYSKAEEQYLVAKEIFTRLGWRFKIARVDRGLGEVYQWQKDYYRAEEAYTRALEISEDRDAQEPVADARKGLGDVYRLRGEHSKAQEQYLVAKEIFTRLGWAFKIARVDWGLGEVYIRQHDYTRAEEAYTRAKGIFEDHDAEGDVANARKRLGDVHRLRGEYPQAEEQYLVAKEIFTRLGWASKVARVDWGLGGVYARQHDNSRAEEAYTRSKEIFENQGVVGYAADARSGLGDVHRLRGEYSKAEEQYLVAKEIFTRLGWTSKIARVDWGLGEVYRCQGNYSRAAEAYTRAKEIFELDPDAE